MDCGFEYSLRVRLERVEGGGIVDVPKEDFSISAARDEIYIRVQERWRCIEPGYLTKNDRDILGSALDQETRIIVVVPTSWRKVGIVNLRYRFHHPLRQERIGPMRLLANHLIPTTVV
jgi:hypothetical protein